MNFISALVNNSAHRIAACVLASLALVTCTDRATIPAPLFEPIFEHVPCDYLSNSSPSMIDLDGDDVPDIVFGSGVDRVRPAGDDLVFGREPQTPGYVYAVSGATNALLWRAPHGGEAFTTPRFADLNLDRVPDVIMGGREAALAAYSGRDGTPLWRAAPASVGAASNSFNFHTPAVVADLNNDRIADLVVMYGGDDTRRPTDARSAGRAVLISGASGDVLAAFDTPDARETYSAIIVYQRADGADWMIFGTGGETFAGALYRAPVASLLDGTFATRTERLIEPGTKGVMAPATLIDLNGDGELDIIASTFDGRLIAVDGATRQILWSKQEAAEETYHQPAIMRISRDGRLGLIVSRAIGVFPNYAGTAHRIYDAVSGGLLYQYLEPLGPAGAPLAVDLDGDGIDEPFFFASRGRVHIHHGASDSLIIHDIPAHLSSTPLIADPRRSGQLELIAATWENRSEGQGVANYRDLSCRLMRLNLNADTPPALSWAGYMGTTWNGRFAMPAGAR